MPPWHADAEPGKFTNDRRLAERDKKLLFDWIDSGMPEGNPGDLPKPATFTDGWQIPKPDLVIEMPKAFAVPQNTLVVADTVGFHARGLSVRPSVRLEVWAYGRRNPFLPWLGLDIAAMPLVKGRAVPLYWSAMDLGERLHLLTNPWQSGGTTTPIEYPAPL